jgi:lycopene beta-cyclase
MGSRTDQEFDYLITGAGAAGRSLAYALLHAPALQDKRILLVDRERKTGNDRTWCFWEDTPGPFESIVKHTWQQLWFYQQAHARLLDIDPYRYKMIRSADFYRFTDAAFAEQTDRIAWATGSVEALTNTPTGVELTVDGRTYRGRYAFNSIPFRPIDKSGVNYLDQHFRGWFVKTPTPVFDTQMATLMDFRIPQRGDFRFLYVLPWSPTEALIEVALFSNDHLTAAGYDRVISDYLATHWPQLDQYEIQETEMGVIPMTDYPFSRAEANIVHLGMAGGDTRASTGYTFYNIQQRVAQIVGALSQDRYPARPEPWQAKRHRYYDSLMLGVLQKAAYPGDKLFAQLFMGSPPDRLLRFLNGHTPLWQELSIMAQVPAGLFLREAVLQQIDSWGGKKSGSLFGSS